MFRLTDAEFEALKQRFLRYAKIHTTSREGADSYPSTERQKDLLRLLVDELHALGVADAAMDEHGYVMATVPATAPVPAAGTRLPVVGLLAHVDTYPEVSGENVKPQVIERYAGGDIVLPGDPSVVIRVADNPGLGRVIGHTLVTSDGTTLLGADDKCGVAAIMTTVAWMQAHPEFAHGPVRVAFTPDEEVGQGTKFFNVEKFGADVAYTLDGGAGGEVEDETFCADALTLSVQGRDVHPGYAKGKMVNSLRVAAALIGRIGELGLPETTADREGYLHPHLVQGNVSQTTIQVLVRAFTVEGLKEREDFVRSLARQVESEFPGARIEVTVTESYRNMKYVLDRDPRVVAYAVEATRAVGLEPIRNAIRGGTDGSRLSYMGLPTPNLFAGGQNFHSKQEWCSLHWTAQAVSATLHLLQRWLSQ